MPNPYSAENAWMRELRVKRGWTQKQMAAWGEISEKHYSFLERGCRPCNRVDLVERFVRKIPAEKGFFE